MSVCVSVVCLTLHDSTTFYHGSTCLYLTLLDSTMAVCLLVHMFACLCISGLYVCMSVCLSFCLFVYQWYVCLFIRLSVCQCLVCPPLSDLSTSFCSPPNATTVLMEESTSSATPPAVAYAPCSFTVKEAMIYGRVKKRIEENWLHYMYIITGHSFEILEDHNSPLKSLQQGKK